MSDVRPLAALRIDHDGEVDTLLLDIARTLTGRGLRVSGVVQVRGPNPGECECSEMNLQNISDGRLFRISQPLGDGSQGCRLDPGALAACSAVLEAEIAEGCDLLILNRFGKGESEGRGFRDLIGLAILEGIPVLTAVRATYAPDWARFGDGIACDMPFSRARALAWCDAVTGKDANAA